MTDEDVRVSVLANEQDVHLLREIAKWRRAQGVNYFQWRPGVGFGVFTEWYRYVDRKRHTVSFEPERSSSWPRLLATVDYYGNQELKELPVTTVTEAVDVLVALGFLPARFSSAYLAGWSSRSTWDGSIRLSNDLGQPLVPAVEPAW